jgi:glycosyltransferase involved in cell wall biosynthesis
MTQKVLHITPHMGKGMGKCLSGLSIGAKKYDPTIEHEMLLLEEPVNTFFNDLCKENGIKIHVTPDQKTTKDLILEADVIQVEWWNHPLTFKFMQTFPKFPVRMVMWDHINGCNHPYLVPELVDIPSKFVATGKYTFDNPYWTEAQREHVREVVPVINSSGGLEGFDKPLVPHEGFNLGYFGTIDYTKMSPDFVSYCKEVSDILDIKFVVIGSGNGLEDLKKDVAKEHLESKFEFTGFSQDPASELARMDAIAYLLNDYTFATTENALLEMMSMGLPVVVFDQCSEQYIVDNYKTGIKIKTREEFSDAIRDIHDIKSLREKLGTNAKKHVSSLYTQENMVMKMHDMYRDVIYNHPAKSVNFEQLWGTTPSEWFKFSLAPDKDAMKKEVMKNNDKQSIHQFIKYFPENDKLKSLVI